MSHLFISHSSKDKEFVVKLANDLKALCYDIWFDEWEIKVGECIPTKIEEGIVNSNYVILVLSSNSISSNWVEKEWKTKYWDEINTKQIMVLPILINDCEIPVLLKTKKYADFRKNYAIGLVELTSSISPIIKNKNNELNLQTSEYTIEISKLIAKVQDKLTPLSNTIAEILIFSQNYNKIDLEEFCRNELAGYDAEKVNKINKSISYRLFELFISLVGKVNLQYYGWGDNGSNILDYMSNDNKKFVPWKFIDSNSVSKIESNITSQSDNYKAILVFTLKTSDLIPYSENPDSPVYGYAKPDTYKFILEMIRGEFTKRLLNLLPDVNTKK